MFDFDDIEKCRRPLMAGNALKAMVTFFTIWQQDITQEDMDAMDERFHLAPIVGALIGVVVLIETAILAKLSVEGILNSSMFTAAVVLATVYVGSRFLHFDGLADFGDGSIVAGTREDHVRALKDTLIGAGGLGVALIIVLLIFSEYSMAGIFAIVLFPMTEVLVKNSQVVTASFGLPSNGMAGKQVSCTDRDSLIWSSVISFVLCLILCFVSSFIAEEIYGLTIFPFYADMVWIVLFGVVATIVSGYLMARRSNRVFGFVNGDILGASHEISRAVVMLVFVLYCGAFL